MLETSQFACLASELGSSREVISRLLENLSARGIIRSARGEIEVLDTDFGSLT
jgi:CRP-like cAMP-binding protein